MSCERWEDTHKCKMHHALLVGPHTCTGVFSSNMVFAWVLLCCLFATCKGHKWKRPLPRCAHATHYVCAVDTALEARQAERQRQLSNIRVP